MRDKITLESEKKRERGIRKEKSLWVPVIEVTDVDSKGLIAFCVREAKKCLLKVTGIHASLE